MPTYGGFSPSPRHYGGKGLGPRLQRIAESLDQARGTAYDVTDTSVVHAENLGIARAINAAWGTNARVANAFDPQRLTGVMLARWEAIMGIFPPPTATEPDRRAAVVLNWQRWGRRFNTSRLIDRVTTLLGATYVQVETKIIAQSTSCYPRGPRNALSNIIAYPENFGNAAWTKNAATITSEAGATPLVGPTAANDLLVETGVTDNHFVLQVIPTLGGAARTLSAHFKARTRTWAAMQIVASSDAGPPYALSFYDLANGVVGTGGAISGTYAASMADAGNGVYRCSLTWTYTPTTDVGYIVLFAGSADNVASYAGVNGSVAIELNGAQLDPAGAAATYENRWMSTVASLLIKVTQPAGMSDGEFYDTVNRANAFLDGEAPAWVTWHWYRENDPINHTIGFILDSPANLDNRIIRI